MRPSVFLTCLGTTNYRPLRYRKLEEEPETVAAVETRFVQLARLKALASRGITLSGAYILVTDKAREENWNDYQERVGLQACLSEHGISAQAITIPDGSSSEHFWQIFQVVADCVPENADIYVDLTHGFRTAPVLVLLALEYVEKVKGAKLVELSYGADRLEQNGEAPTWNLAPFLIIREWADAVDLFLRNGDVRALSALAAGPTRQLKRQLKAGMPPSLERLPRELGDFGESLVKCHAPSLKDRTTRLRQTLAGAKQECSVRHELRPMSLVLDRLESELLDFHSPVAEGHEELRICRAACAWCLRFGLAMQAFTFAREAFVTMLFLCAGSPPVKRVGADKLFGTLDAYFAGFHVEGQWASLITEWNSHPPLPGTTWEKLKTVLGKLRNRRNGLDHAHMGEDHPVRPPSDETLNSLGAECLSVLDEFLAFHLSATKNVASAPPT